MKYSKHIKKLDYIQKNIYCIVLNKAVLYYSNLLPFEQGENIMFYVITFLILWCGFGLYLLDTEKNPKRMNLDDVKDKLRKL